MKMYEATVDGIREFEARYESSPHIDHKSMTAYASTPEEAKRILCDALNKRVQGALQTWELCRDRAEKASKLEVAA